MGSLLRLSILAVLALTLAAPASAGFLDDAKRAIGGAVQQGQEAVGGAIQQGQQAFGDIQRGAGQAAQQIGEALKPLTQSDFRLNFRVDCTGASAKAKPGESATVTFACTGGQGTVTVTVLGRSGSQSFDTPLGSASVPLGAQDVATLNVNIAGSLRGTILASPSDATVTPSSLTWSSYGPRSVTVKIPSTAQPGTRYTVTVRPTYTATVGGSISALGSTQSIGSFNAPVFEAPATTATIDVVAPSFLPGFEVGPAIAGLLVAAFLWQSRRRR